MSIQPRAGGRKGKGKGNDRRRRATHLDGAVEGAGHERGGRQRRGAVRSVVVIVALDGRHDVRVLRERAISRGGEKGVAGGKAPIYGLAGGLPDRGLIGDILKDVQDLMLKNA